MSVESARRSDIPPELREKYIKRRKEVEFLDKWGRWLCIFNIAVGLLGLCAIIVLVVLLQRLIDLPGNPAPQAKNLMWAGFVLGTMIGCWAGFMTYKVAHFVCEGVGYLHGKPASRMLVEYHDALVNLMHEEQRQMADGSDALPSRDSMPASEPNR